LSSRPNLRDWIQVLAQSQQAQSRPLERFRAELDFAVRLAEAHLDEAAEWTPLIERAAQSVAEGLSQGCADAEALVAEAETLLAPLGDAAKQYTIYCCGHAHIDMNWMWSWPETVAVTHDTFTTMDRLMDEFPAFHFSQSQASVYKAMQQYAPEVFERLRRRVAEGRWEVTASQWVEGDKNLASGEILCRHLLYARRWFHENFGLPYDAVKIDWECDTFGHCWTLPGILARGGVTRYYHHRASGPRLRAMASGESSQLFWWQGKDGSRVLAYDDSPNGYNGEITPRMTHLLFALERHTGLKSLLWVYGVGDHGGGPTRRHLRAAADMQQWPIWPRVELSTTDAFFTAVEREIEERSLELPVHDDELNFVFEGCYTSESRIKFANRTGENDLVDTEIAALLASRLCGLAYPADVLTECWERAMFLQFHDILPGSGVRETVEHALGLFQENLANSGMIRTRGLRALAACVDTSALAPAERPGAHDLGLGGGAGDGAWWGGVSTLGAGESGADPFLVFNPAPFARDEVVQVKIWNRELADGRVIVRDAAGHTTPGQVTQRGNYWGHTFTVVAFPTKDLPATGYRAYVVESGSAQADEGAYVRETGRPVYGLGYVHAQMLSPLVMGNEYLELVLSPEAGGIVSLVDKQTRTQFVPPGCVLGALDREQEAPHGMTAWQLGAIVDRAEPLADCVLSAVHHGPHMAIVRLVGRHNASDYDLTISLARGACRVDFSLNVNWLERGDPSTGVPALRASFPLAADDPRATYEIACGSLDRPTDGGEVPALTWADLTGSTGCSCEARAGLTLLNDSKYGHSALGNILRLTLLRSSYDPDPLPELGRHEIRWAIVPHVGALDLGAAHRAGYAFNHRCVAVGTTVHEGRLPSEGSMVEVLTPNVMLSGLKQAEGSDAVVVRLYEVEGKETRAQVRLSPLLIPADARVTETDLLEQPSDDCTASFADGVLSVTIPPFGIATVRIGG